MPGRPNLYRRYIARCRRWSWKEGQRVLFSGTVIAGIGAYLLVATGVSLTARLIGAAINSIGVVGIWSGVQVAIGPRQMPPPSTDNDKEN